MHQLEQILGYTFQQKSLLSQALVHPSTKQDKDNQRLEFLGDAVLEFCISSLLYQKYPLAQEGDLTARRAALVCEKTLSLLAQKLSLGRFLQMGIGEQQQRGGEKPSILADALEAVFAALYLDGGITAAQEVIFTLYQDEETLSAVRGRDDKGLLQEYTQAHGMDLPAYQITQETGPAHQKHFTAQVSVLGKPLATGNGISKKSAEQAAAKAALTTLTQT